MSNTKKWEAVVSAGMVYVRDNQTNIGVCVVGHGEPTQQEKENAALIAAAPEMLAALIEMKKITKVLGAGIGKIHVPDGFFEQWNNAELLSTSAIHKAQQP